MSDRATITLFMPVKGIFLSEGEADLRTYSNKKLSLSEEGVCRAQYSHLEFSLGRFLIGLHVNHWTGGETEG